jgi:hypothetical protein
MTKLIKIQIEDRKGNVEYEEYFPSFDAALRNFKLLKVWYQKNTPLKKEKLPLFPKKQYIFVKILGKIYFLKNIK